jgi:nitrogenase-stabilizing/protective protein
MPTDVAALAAHAALAADARRAVDQLAAFRNASAAEDYFDALDVSYDARVVAVNRLHILRMLSQRIAAAELEQSAAESAPEELVATYHRCLVDAYDAFVGAGALDHRLFKVLQDRVPAQPVPVELVTVRAGRGADDEAGSREEER